MRISRTLAPLVLAAVVTSGLVACASGDAPKPSPSAAAEAPAAATTDAATAAPEETDEAAAPAGDYVAPAWAKPVTSPGEPLTTVEGTNFTVEISEIGTTAATRTGQFVDPETNTPLIEVGDEIVFVNYVVTNTSDESIPLSYNLVDITARYADWPYLQGMDSVVDSALDDQMQINDTAIGTTGAEAPFALAAGESFSYGQNFTYQAGSAITFVTGLTPADEAGDLVHDKREEVEVSTTIK